MLGAGAVGTEFASIYTSFGTKVTLIEMLPRILPIEDEEVSAELQKALRKRGIDVMTGTKMPGVEQHRERRAPAARRAARRTPSRPSCCWSPSAAGR